MREYRQTISNDEIRELPVGLFPGRTVVVTRDNLDEACDYLESFDLLGFDTETKPSFKAGVENKVSLIQLSTADTCFLFRICRMPLDTRILRILRSESVRKVGVDVTGDIRNLQKIRHFKPGGFIELQKEVLRYGIQDQSLRKIAAIVCGQSISKAQRLSNWAAATLTPAQQDYAATDAWICLEIYRKLTSDE